MPQHYSGQESHLHLKITPELRACLATMATTERSTVSEIVRTALYAAVRDYEPGAYRRLSLAEMGEGDIADAIVRIKDHATRKALDLDALNLPY